MAVPAAVDQEFVMGEKAYRVRPLRPQDMSRLNVFLATQIPDPRGIARKYMDGLPDAVAMHVWDRACDEAKAWPPNIEDPRVESLFFSAEGVATLVEIALGRTIAGFTRQDAERIAGEMDTGDIVRFFALLFPKPAAATNPQEPGGEDGR